MQRYQAHMFFTQLYLLFFLFALSACASTRTLQKHYMDTVPLAQNGAYNDAALIIRESKNTMYQEKDRVLYHLDLGMLLHWAGAYDASNQHLTHAENAIEELFTQSISKEISSVLLNDNALDYGGEDYENIYINVFKALNYIFLENIESAHVEIRRMQIKLDLLENKYKKIIDEHNASEGAIEQLQARKNRFYNDVLARYLSLLLYRSEGASDDFRIEMQALNEAWETQSHLYNFPKPPLPSPKSAEEGNALVNVLSFQGLSPIKLADTLLLHTASEMIFIGIEGQNEDYTNDLVGFTAIPMPNIQDGIHFKMQFPRLESRPSSVDRVIVKFDGERVAELPVLENIENIARETFLIKQPLTIGRTIIRATLKNISKEMGKKTLQEELGSQGNGGLLAGLFIGLALDMVVDATENADLRISHFFPSVARAAEIEIEPGSYYVTIEYWNKNTLLAEKDHGIHDFSTQRINLIESTFLQ